MFWSLDIEFCDLFVIWCLKFGIYLHQKFSGACSLKFTSTLPGGKSRAANAALDI